jgi:WD40 repeat protein
MRTRLAFVTAAVTSLLVVGTASVAEAVSTTPARCAQPDGRVSTIAIADGVAYLGGSFTHVKDVSGVSRSRLRLAAVDTSSCDLLPWDPSADGDVYALTVAGGQVFVGGAFGTVGGLPRARLAAVGTNGAVLTWNPSANRTVRALASSASRLYVGGDFTTIGSTKRSRLAAFSLAGGALDGSWVPKASQGVLALAYSASSGKVYAGGNFTSLDGDGRAAYVGALDATTGRVDSGFFPQPGFPVLALASSNGGVYAGAGGAGGHLVIWNTDGSLQQPVYQTDGGVQAVVVSGGSLYAGGHFANYCLGNSGSGSPFICDHPLQRRKLFQVNLSSGDLTSFAPAFNSARGVLALAIDPTDGALWVGGDFTKVGSTVAAHLAVLR